MAIPFLGPILLGAGGWLAGKSASGGGIEIGTSKKETANINVVAPFSPFIFSPTNAQDYSTNIISNSPNSSISTKKEDAVSGATTPISYALPIELGQAQGSGTAIGEPSSGGGIDYMTMVVLAGLGLGAWVLLKKDKGDKK